MALMRDEASRVILLVTGVERASPREALVVGALSALIGALCFFNRDALFGMYRRWMPQSRYLDRDEATGNFMYFLCFVTLPLVMIVIGIYFSVSALFEL
jgi:hypothetical protein